MDKNRRDELVRTREWSERVQDANAAGPASSNEDSSPEEQLVRRESAEFNARVHHALAEIPVPPNLREQILARSKIVPVRSWGQQKHLLAMAAALALVATLSFAWLRQQEDKSFAGFRSRMVNFAVRQYSMDLHTNQLAAVQSFLTQNGAPTADSWLPSGLQGGPVMGGANLSWQGKPVGMICFRHHTGKTLYMFIINSADVPGVTPRFNAASEKTLATATWQHGGKTFLLAGDVPLQELESLAKS